MNQVERYITAVLPGGKLCCRLCGSMVVFGGPHTGVTDEYYEDLFSVRGHFLSKHINCPTYSDEKISYIWVYSDRNNFRDREVASPTVCRVYSSLIVELFPQLLFVKWENTIADLLLRFAKECATKKGDRACDLGVTTVSGDAYDGMKKIMTEQTYICLFCDAEFNGAPSAELLAEHFASHLFFKCLYTIF